MRRLRQKIRCNQARSLIEQAEALGEPLDDPLLLFSVLVRILGCEFQSVSIETLFVSSPSQFLALAEKQKATDPMMVGHRLVGSFAFVDRRHYRRRAPLRSSNRAIRSGEHRLLATRFGQDMRVAHCVADPRPCGIWDILKLRSPISSESLKDAREIGHAATLMFALFYASGQLSACCRDYAAANSLIDELVALAEEKSAACGNCSESCARGALFAVTGTRFRCSPR